MAPILTAIIDDGVSGTCGVKEHYVVAGKEVMPFIPAESFHGTMCALAFASVTGMPYCLSICLCRDENGNLCSDDLITALQWCIGKRVELVSISAGAVRSDKLCLLNDVIQQAAEAGMIIVASADNSGEIIYPACLDGVLGVCSDYLDLLADNEYAYAADSFDGINWVVSSDSKGPESPVSTDYGVSNSRAAAIMAGTVFNAMRRKPHGLSADSIIRELMEAAKKCGDYGNAEFMRRKIKSDYDPEQTVIVLLHGDAIRRHDEIKELFIKDGYRVISVKDEKPDLVNSIFSLASLNALNLIAHATKPDLILADIPNHEYLMRMEYDVLIGDGNMPDGEANEINKAGNWTLFIDCKNRTDGDIFTAIVNHFS